jgi:hypothetical protein
MLFNYFLLSKRQDGIYALYRLDALLKRFGGKEMNLGLLV